LDEKKQREIDKMAELKDARKMKTSALLNDTAKRKKLKELKNLSGGGFKIHVNHRYILDDGRIGVCRFKGRTQFGKSSEDWVGIVVEYGKGRHNGTVNGKMYFRCREGQGVMVKTERILIDVGNRDKAPIDGAMKRKAKALSEEYAVLQEEKERVAAERKKKKKKKGWRVDDEYAGWSPPQWDDYEEDHSEMFGQKLHYSKTLLDKNKGKKADKKLHHTQV